MPASGTGILPTTNALIPRSWEGDMPKKQSDIFVYRLKNGEYWAHPSPFIVRSGGRRILFRNLSADEIEIDLTDLPVRPTRVRVGSGKRAWVTVAKKPSAQVHEYKAHVMPAPTRAPERATSEPIHVMGGSSPKIIIDG
jgi:hypothetical protein